MFGVVIGLGQVLDNHSLMKYPHSYYSSSIAAISNNFHQLLKDYKREPGNRSSIAPMLQDAWEQASEFLVANQEDIHGLELHTLMHIIHRPVKEHMAMSSNSTNYI